METKTYFTHEFFRNLRAEKKVKQDLFATDRINAMLDGVSCQAKKGI